MREALAELRAEKHISFSAINTYLRCPRQYQYRYILRIPPSHRSAALAYGTATHAALAMFYEHIQSNKPEPSVKEMQAVFTDSWHQQQGGEIPVLLNDGETPEGLVESANALIAVFHEQAPRPHKVIGVEEAFSIECHDSDTGEVFQERLVGVFDAIAQDKNGQYRVLEHKSAGRRWAESQRENDLQVSAYSLAAGMTGLGDAEITVQLLLKNKKPAIEVYNLRRTEADRRDFLRVASGVIRAVNAGIFYPRRDFFCRNCEYAGPCMAG